MNVRPFKAIPSWLVNSSLSTFEALSAYCILSCHIIKKLSGRESDLRKVSRVVNTFEKSGFLIKSVIMYEHRVMNPFVSHIHKMPTKLVEAGYEQWGKLQSVLGCPTAHICSLNPMQRSSLHCCWPSWAHAKTLLHSPFYGAMDPSK